MSSSHYLQHLDPRYAVKTEAEAVYHPASAADLFGISSSTSPAHSNHHHNHLLHGAVATSPSPAAAHQQHHNSHHQLQHHQHQHLHQQHQQQPPHGYVAFTTQILDAVNLAPAASAAAYAHHHHHNNHHHNNTSSPSPTGVNNSGGVGMVTAKEEPVEMTAASITATAVRAAPPKVPGRRRHIKPERKKFACDKCEFRTAARGNLILHDNSVHLKIKHPCDQCKYEATQVIGR